MKVDEIHQTQACKFSRVVNGGNDNYPNDEEDGEVIKRTGGNGGKGWHNSSRIIRVCRASGGKDRHSKVWTSKGLRDRRVRLSVTTAIQFYDLQDRLGCDQPSKAVEWLIKAASDAIDELPSLNSSFPDTPKQFSDEKRANGEITEQGFEFDSVEMELDGDPNNYQQKNQSQNLNISLSKSACSSTSETSKNSGLSLSRSTEIRLNRVKARERAKERAAKDKEKEQECSISLSHHQNVNPISQSSSFTELLTASSAHQNPNGDTARQWPVSQMDYLTKGLLEPSSSSSSSRSHQYSSGFPRQIQLGNFLPHSISIPSFNVSAGENYHQELQHFSFVPTHPDHLIPVATTTQPGPGGDYNLNYFTIPSGLAGLNRGTLQSNSPFLPHQIQRFSSIDGSSPFYIGTPPMENHHNNQLSAGLDSRLQLCYGDGSRSSDQKGKGKN